MSILDHLWGESRESDRVWAQVSGLGSEAADRRLLMSLAAYIDESFGTEGTVVLAGHIATAESWVRFSDEWKQLLRSHGVLSSVDNIYRFKMSEMASLPERMERVPAFFRVIERHAPVSISVRVHTDEIRRAIRRVHVPGVSINWEEFENTYTVALYALLDIFHLSKDRLQPIIGHDDKVDFIFDNRSEKKAVISGWDSYLAKKSPELRARFGATPRFEVDDEFLPLQAADFWAWWVRRWYVDGDKEYRLSSGDFGSWKASTGLGRLILDMAVNEDDLVKGFKANIAGLIEPGRPVWDVRYPF